MNWIQRVLVPALCVCALGALAFPAPASAQAVRLDRCVISSAAIEASGSVGLRGSAGQPAVGRVDGTALDAWLGFWYQPSTMTVGLFDEAQPLPAVLDAAVFPNPTVGDVGVRLALDEAAEVTATVVDAAGRTLSRRAMGMFPPGDQSFTLSAAELGTEYNASGLRFIVLRATGSGGAVQQQVLTLVLLR